MPKEINANARRKEATETGPRGKPWENASQPDKPWPRIRNWKRVRCRGCRQQVDCSPDSARCLDRAVDHARNCSAFARIGGISVSGNGIQQLAACLACGASLSDNSHTGMKYVERTLDFKAALNAHASRRIEYSISSVLAADTTEADENRLIQATEQSADKGVQPQDKSEASDTVLNIAPAPQLPRPAGGPSTAEGKSAPRTSSGSDQEVMQAHVPSDMADKEPDRPRTSRPLRRELDRLKAKRWQVRWT